MITSEVESFEGLFLVYAFKRNFCLKESKKFIQKSSIEQKNFDNFEGLEHRGNFKLNV